MGYMVCLLNSKTHFWICSNNIAAVIVKKKVNKQTEDQPISQETKTTEGKGSKRKREDSVDIPFDSTERLGFGFQNKKIKDIVKTSQSDRLGVRVGWIISAL